MRLTLDHIQLFHVARASTGSWAIFGLFLGLFYDLLMVVMTMLVVISSSNPVILFMTITTTATPTTTTITTTVSFHRT